MLAYKVIEQNFRDFLEISREKLGYATWEEWRQRTRLPPATMSRVLKESPEGGYSTSLRSRDDFAKGLEYPGWFALLSEFETQCTPTGNTGLPDGELLVEVTEEMRSRLTSVFIRNKLSFGMGMRRLVEFFLDVPDEAYPFLLGLVPNVSREIAAARVYRAIMLRPKPPWRNAELKDDEKESLLKASQDASIGEKASPDVAASQGSKLAKSLEVVKLDLRDKQARAQQIAVQVGIPPDKAVEFVTLWEDREASVGALSNAKRRAAEIIVSQESPKAGRKAPPDGRKAAG